MVGGLLLTFDSKVLIPHNYPNNEGGSLMAKRNRSQMTTGALIVTIFSLVFQGTIIWYRELRKEGMTFSDLVKTILFGMLFAILAWFECDEMSPGFWIGFLILPLLLGVLIYSMP